MGAAEAIAFARAQIGKPYVFGATGPDSYDCSGLVQAACKAGGVSIARVTYDQIFNGSEVHQSDLQPGDLIFPDIGHVQLYSGNNMVIEAPHTGAFVREVSMWGFWRARRVFVDGASVGGGTGINTTVADQKTAGLGIGSLSETVSILNDIASPSWWRRIAVGVMGAIIIALALYWLNHEKINHAVATTAKTVGEVAL